MQITRFLQCPDIFHGPYENQSFWFVSYYFLRWNLKYLVWVWFLLLCSVYCNERSFFFFSPKAAVFTAFRVKWGYARRQTSFGNVSFPKKTHHGTSCAGARALCAFVRHDFAIYKVCGRLLTVTGLLLVLFGDLQACFFPWVEYFFKGNVYFFCMWAHAWGKWVHLSRSVPGWLLKSLWPLC